MGTLVNTVSVIIGGITGLFIKKYINDDMRKALDSVLGLCVAFLGLFGALSSMGTVTDGKIETNGTLLLIISMSVGTVFGTVLKINEKLDNFGKLVENKIKINSFSDGFISASLLFCVGAMAIIGCINDGLNGDATVLYTKSMLDGISAIVLSSALGSGVIFSAVTVLIYQGALTLLAGTLSPLLSGELLNNICMVGYAIVVFIGTNMMGITKAKTADMLPSLLIPVIYNIFR